MRKKVFLVISGDLVQLYLTDERHQQLAFAIVVIAIVLQKRKLHPVRKVRKTPPMALSLERTICQ